MKFHLEPGLRKLTSKPSKVPVFGIDTETYGNNSKMVLGSLIGDNYEFKFTKTTELEQELLRNQAFKGSHIAATNLLFDFFTLWPWDEAFKKFSIIERSSNIIYCKTYIPYKQTGNFIHPMARPDKHNRESYPITFIDSGNHLKMSVEELGKIVGIPKLPHPKRLGHYPKTQEEYEELEAYNLNDSRITYSFIKFIQDQYNNLGGKLKITVSSTAMDLFRRKYLKSFWKAMDRESILYQYKGYYGGRTETFKRGLFENENYGNIFNYDVNSLYPFCMKKFQYPYINKYAYWAKMREDDVYSFEGMGQFTLKAPDDLNIPLVPFKSDKLRFTTGKMKGIYDFMTVRKAVDLGYEILDYQEGYVFEHKFRPFKEMITDLYKLRQQYKSEGNKAEIAVKLAMNSLYGKFGYNFANKEILGTMEDYKNYPGTDCVPIPLGGDTDLVRIVGGKNSKIPSYVFPILSTYVTAYARAYVFDKMKSCGLNRVFYTDTDSIYTDRQLPTSGDLGDIKLENTYKRIMFIKAKFYAGETISGSETIRIKGIPRQGIKLDVLINQVKSRDVVFNLNCYRKLRGSLSGGEIGKKWVNQNFEMSKRLDLDDDKRTWAKKHFTLQPQDSAPMIGNLDPPKKRIFSQY